MYNLLGQRIALLMDETRAAGIHEITWMPGGVPAGLYFLVLQTQKERRMHKVIYVK